MPAQTRYRVMHKFWLDLKKDNEDQLDERIHELKVKRTFVKTIRDALRLFFDLKHGRVDVLFELFPFVKAELLVEIHPQKTAGELELQHQLERLEKLLTSERAVLHDTTRQLQPIIIDGPQALNTPKFDLPRFDDEEDTLVIQRDTNTDSALNFLNSMLRLQQ